MLVLGCIAENFSTRKDGTIKGVFGFNEMPDGHKAELFSHHNKYLVLALKSEGVIKEDEIPEIDTSGFQRGKRPSERLRASLYRLWEQGDKSEDSEAHYKRNMEKIINWVQEKLS